MFRAFRRLRFDLFEWKPELERKIRQLQAEKAALLRDKHYLKAWLAYHLKDTMPDFPTAAWMPSEHFWSGHHGKRPQFVIIHTTNTTENETPEDIALKHADQMESMHYIVGRDGKILQTVSEVHTATATGDVVPGHEPFWTWTNLGCPPAWVAFGIELMADADGKLSQDTLTAAFVLIKSLMERHVIPAQIATESGGVTGYHSMNRKSESGKDFPYSALIDYILGVEVPIEEAPAEEVIVEQAPTEETPAEEAKPAPKKRAAKAETGE